MRSPSTCTASPACTPPSARYEDERRTEVLRLQSAARNSTEWFEEVERYLHLDPVQFNYSLLTRSQRISHENLRAARQGVAGRRGDVVRGAAPPASRPNAARPPMFTPFRLRDLQLEEPHRRLADGAVSRGRRHADGLALRALRRARQGRRRAGHHRDDLRLARGAHHAGLHGPVRAPSTSAAWKRIVDFVHAETDAKIAMQLGHSGPKGSTQLGWETMDAPLRERQLGGDGALARAVVAATTRCRAQMTRADMDEVRDEFVRAAEMAERAGFDMLELHYAHGYLMSAFITPLTNRRTDDYGGTLENRMRFPLEVFHAVRAVWPAQQADLGAHLGQRLGRRATASRRRTRSPIARLLQAGRRRHHRRVGRADLASQRGPFTAACSRRRSPIASATRSASPPWPSATSTSPITSTRS